MIITKTPFRISFAGGGTDIKEFYEKEGGAVLSTTINKFMYLGVHKYFEPKILLKYSKTECVDSVDQIEHKLIKQCFLKTGTDKHLEVTSFADVPAGTGLGSSSAFTIGLLKALHTFHNRNVNNLSLAKQTCDIEIEELKEPIGKQDQYACALGGFNLITFSPEGEVMVEPILISSQTKKKLEENLIMFYTGITRSASAILTEQKKEVTTESKFVNLQKMRNLAFELKITLEAGNLEEFGTILHKEWMLKKEITSSISNQFIDEYYNKALALGATGGKILGAGGGGFFLFYCDKSKQDNLRANLGLKEFKFKFEPQGSRTIYVEDDED
ncbi:MAG: GHMP kinase [Nanoarchaeota archaeon]